MLTGRNHLGNWADFMVNCLTGYKHATMRIFFRVVLGVWAHFQSRSNMNLDTQIR